MIILNYGLMMQIQLKIFNNIKFTINFASNCESLCYDFAFMADPFSSFRYWDECIVYVYCYFS